MRQYAGMGDAEESNKRYKYLLGQGTTGLSVAFDLPTQIGLDADHPLAAGEVGKVGVSICSVEDMERLFDGIALVRAELDAAAEPGHDGGELTVAEQAVTQPGHEAIDARPRMAGE